MIESMLVDDTIFYLNPDWGTGGLQIAKGTGTVPANKASVNVAGVELVTDADQEGEAVTWEILVLVSDLTPNMATLVYIGTCGRSPVGKYARVIGVEQVGNPGGVIPPYWQVTVKEYRAT